MGVVDLKIEYLTYDPVETPPFRGSRRSLPPRTRRGKSATEHHWKAPLSVYGEGRHRVSGVGEGFRL